MFFVVVYAHIVIYAKLFSFLSLYFGDTTSKTVTCTWLNAVGFLTKEPPTGNNTGSILSAAVSELISLASKEDGGN